MMITYPIVPLCEKQLRDVKESDRIAYKDKIVARTCVIDKAGGGYDQFRQIYQKRYKRDTGNRHVIFQVRGCTLSCPWCYVTEQGVWGKPVDLTCDDIVNILETIVPDDIVVFHLMGGASALYLDRWRLLMAALPSKYVFHSDFLLNESLYDKEILQDIVSIRKNSQLHAVSIKPFGKLSRLQLENLSLLYETGINFYITFTEMNPDQIEKIRTQCVCFGLPLGIFEDSFVIPLKHYKALE